MTFHSAMIRYSFVVVVVVVVVVSCCIHLLFLQLLFLLLLLLLLLQGTHSLTLGCVLGACGCVGACINTANKCLRRIDTQSTIPLEQPGHVFFLLQIIVSFLTHFVHHPSHTHTHTIYIGGGGGGGAKEATTPWCDPGNVPSNHYTAAVVVVVVVEAVWSCCATATSLFPFKIHSSSSSSSSFLS